MARYTVKYDNGRDQTITADTIVCDEDQYVAYTNGVPSAFIPMINVLSIVHVEDEVVSE